MIRNSDSDTLGLHISGEGLTPTQQAMAEQLARIINQLHRPATFRDFVQLKVKGKVRKLAEGTVRNNISAMRARGLVENAYTSSTAFYTVPGVKFAKPRNPLMTPFHIGAIEEPPRPKRLNNDLTALIERMVMDAPAVHDIHLSFHSPMSWELLHTAGRYQAKRRISQDLFLKAISVEGMTALITAHHTNTISAILACSSYPVRLDPAGIARLSSALTRIELTVKQELEKSAQEPKTLIQVPAHDGWTVNQWHLGIDSIETYNGEKFEATWRDAVGKYTRIYSKKIKAVKGLAVKQCKRCKTIIRIERLEQPRKSLKEAVDERLQSHGGGAIA